MAFARPSIVRLIVSVVALFAHTGAVVALPWLVKWTIDSRIGSGDASSLNLVAVLFLAVGAMQYVTNMVHRRTLEFAEQQLLRSLRVALFDHLQRLSMAYFDRNEAGKIMSRIQSDVEQLANFLGIVVFSTAQTAGLIGGSARFHH